MRAWLVITLALLARVASAAESFDARVVGVHDGDTVTVLRDGHDQVRIRVEGIDAPELGQEAAAGPNDLETRVRHACRDWFHSQRLLDRLVPDIERVLTDDLAGDSGATSDFDADGEQPGGLWDPERGEVPGGVNFGED